MSEFSLEGRQVKIVIQNDGQVIDGLCVLDGKAEFRLVSEGRIIVVPKRNVLYAVSVD
ncbi:MAG: hypothetical protein QW692_04250 [Nitrososphaerota archaeon]